MMETSEIYREVSDNLKSYILIYNFDRDEIKYMNNNLRESFDIKEGMTLNNMIKTFVRSDYIDKVLDSLKKRLATFKGGDHSYSVTYKTEDLILYNEDNQEIEAEVFSKLIDKFGQTDILIVIHDVTKYKILLNQKEELIQKLKESEQELSKLKSQLVRKNIRLNELATKDELTAIYNRYYFNKILEDEVVKSHRFKEAISLIIFDIDDFKEVNDTYGHIYGDYVLKQIAITVKKTIKRPDIFARWGGEEFVILLPQTNIKGAINCANRLVKEIASIDFDDSGPITASFGVSQQKVDEEVEEWFNRTDELLYDAKTSGKNCVKTEVLYNNYNLDFNRVNWNFDWSRSNKVVDLQHRYLIRLINNINNNIKVNEKEHLLEENIDLLYKALRYHFSYEEVLLKKKDIHSDSLCVKKHISLLNRLLYLKQELLAGRIMYKDFFNFINLNIIESHISDKTTPCHNFL